MVNEALQNYVNLVSGLTRTTRAKAAAGARSLLAQAGLDEASERVSKLADEIVSASKANRELMRNLIASEVEQVVGKLGFVRSEELERLRAEFRTLQETVAGRPAAPVATQDIASEDIPARNAAAKKAAIKKTPTKKAAVKKAGVTKPGVTKAGVTKAEVTTAAGKKPAEQPALGDDGPGDG